MNEGRQRSFFSKQRPAPTFTIALSLVLTVVGVVLAFLPISESWGRTLGEALAFASIAALVITLYSEVQRGIDQIIQSTQGKFENRLLMQSHESLEPVRARARQAINVKNTFIDHRESTAGGATVPYTFHSPRRLDLYSTFFGSHGRSWVDVISRSTALSDVAELSDIRTAIARTTRMPREDVGDRDYKTYVLKQSLPMVNFIIFEYPESRKEVLWGWGFHTKEPSADVYLSSDRFVIDYFEHLFDALRNDAAEDIEHPDSNIYFERRWMGVWVEKGDNGREASWAVRQIKFERFRTQVTCHIFDSAGNRVRYYQTTNVNIERGIISIGYDSQIQSGQDCIGALQRIGGEAAAKISPEEVDVFSQLTRRGFARLEMGVLIDADNFRPHEPRGYRGFVILTPANGAGAEGIKLEGARVDYGILQKLFPGDKAQYFDDVEIADLAKGMTDVPIYESRIFSALAKASPAERVSWFAEAHGFSDKKATS